MNRFTETRRSFRPGDVITRDYEPGKMVAVVLKGTRQRGDVTYYKVRYLEIDDKDLRSEFVTGFVAEDTGIAPWSDPKPEMTEMYDTMRRIRDDADRLDESAQARARADKIEAKYGGGSTSPKNRTRFEVLDKIAADPRVKRVWDEGDNGIWAELASGWTNDGERYIHGIGEDPVEDLIASFNACMRG